MALVPCPECKAQVSRAAASCPQCGFPLGGVTIPGAAFAAGRSAAPAGEESLWEGRPSLKALAAMKDVQQFAELDMGPAITVLVLSLVFAVVLVAAAIAVGVIAAGLRLPRERRLGQEAAIPAVSPGGSTAAPLEPPSRAAHVAAAAIASARREEQAATVTTIGPRRLVVVSDRAAPEASAPSNPSVVAAVPLGARYRRPASPRRSAARARSDP